MQFSQFKPMNKLPIGFTAAGQIDKMKEFIKKLAAQSSGEIKVDQFTAWISEGFDITKINP